MKNYARIVDNVAVDVSSDPAAHFHPALATLFVEVPSEVRPGWRFGDIEGWREVIAPESLMAVPQVISRRQAKQALLQAGLLDVADAAIAASGDRAAQIDWADAQEFRRDWATLISMQNALSLTDEQIDDLFRLAATL